MSYINLRAAYYIAVSMGVTLEKNRVTLCPIHRITQKSLYQVYSERGGKYPNEPKPIMFKDLDEAIDEFINLSK